ncbi:fungal-specific transcription factor domain-containing protein [Mycena vulgaris]|nr:fungal-specific transcription factor domain-containing protein [Mycena vulgaris]
MASESVEGTKKRRLRGSCDICRRQKIRCDSARMPGNRCSNCVSFNSECTHKISQQKEDKGPRRKRTAAQKSTSIGEETTAGDSSRVSETAKNVVDGLLRQPSDYQAPGDREALFQLLLEVARYARSLEQELDTSHGSQTSPSVRIGSNSVSPRAEQDDAESESGIVVDLQKLPEHFRRVMVDTSNRRFFGKNSSLLFVRAAIEGARYDNIYIPPMTRREFWTPLPWEASPEPPVTQIFPPDDLLWDLVEIYFSQLNIYSFILHGPTFKQSLVEGLHLRDHRFGAIVLAVCALASKNSPDERVLFSGTPGEISAGWKWFRQIGRPFSGPVVETASLYELQLCCLYLMFQQTGFNQESCWLLSGIGILYAQDVGVHRRPDPNGPLNLRDEMLKRCFYYLSTFNAICSACFGRPGVVKASESDLDLPVLCDDEYWQHPDPEKAFKQPPGKPSLVEYYVAYIKLVQIFTFSWRKPGEPLQDYTGQRPLEAKTIAELDSRLNKWAEEIPEHLLWNPYMGDDAFFSQSAALYAAYYHVQLMVHRPFIVKQIATPSTFKSLAICTNAARSCSHVVDVKSRRGFMPAPHVVKAAFDSAVALLLNVSGGARSGLAIDIARELVDVYKCMSLLRETERRWQNAGRYYDIICELMSVNKLPLPPVTPPEIPLDQLIGNFPGLESVSELHIDDGYAQNPGLESWPGNFLSLPLAVEDLSRLPIYGTLDLSEIDVLDKIIPDLPPAINTSETVDSQPWNLDYPVYTGSNLYGFSRDSALNNEMDMDPYLSYWMPYFSSVDGMTQMMQNATSGN